MKKHSTELFDLVTSLTLSERRYCALYLQRHNSHSGNRYLQLFQVLCKSTAYRSEENMQLTGQQKKPAHYSVLKKQLYEQLLDALHQYDLFTNPEQQLQRGIHQCHLLLQKGLFGQCEKRIDKLWKTAEAMNHYEAQLQLQQLKMMMKARKYYRHVNEKELEGWHTTTVRIITDLSTSVYYRYLSSRVYKMQFDAGVRGKALAATMKPIVALPEFSRESKANTPRAQLDFLQVKALYHFTNLETAKAAHYNGRFLQLLDQNASLKQVHADRYFSVLNNYLIDCLVLKAYPTLESGLVTLRQLPQIPAFKRLVNFDANVFRLSSLLEMNYRITIGDFNTAYRLLPGITAGLKKYGDKIVKHNRITLQYLKAYSCFALERYEEALDELFPVTQEKESAVAEELQTAARMLQLLCYFEKGEVLLLESLAKSLRRIFRTRKQPSDIQTAVISFILSTGKKADPQTADWQKLEREVIRLSRDKTAGGMNLFNYRAWVSRHVTATTFAQAWATVNRLPEA